MTDNKQNIKELPQKQKLFCKYYGTVGETFQNATQSYIKAGYSQNGAKENASTLLKKDSIKQELDRIAIESALSYNITPDWVKDQCYICYDRAKQAGDWPSARAFLDLAGKCVGAYTSKAVDNTIELEPTEPEQRKAWLEAELNLLQRQEQAGTGLPPTLTPQTGVDG